MTSQECARCDNQDPLRCVYCEHFDNPAAEHEPEPAECDQSQVVAYFVLADIQARVAAGEAKYGTKLKTHNGRDALMDAYQEALDLVMYLRQALLERDSR